MQFSSLAIRALQVGRQKLRFFDPVHRKCEIDRAKVEARLAGVARRSGKLSSGPTRVLIDGMWFNPNYWYRLALIRAAVMASGGQEIGLVGIWSADRSRQTFSRLGVKKLVRFDQLLRDASAEAHNLTNAALSTTQTADDVLQWSMPGGLPTDFVYDGILKRQRGAIVDVNSSNFSTHATEAYASALAAERLLDQVEPDLVVLSHAINFSFAAIAWSAMKRGVPVIVLFGNYGVPRFFRIESPEDLRNWNSGPSNDEIDAISPALAADLSTKGLEYLSRRFAGLTSDIGAQFAYVHADKRVDRASLVKQFGWTTEKPIVIVYAHNWFDFPHGYGMSHFRDFLDWITATIEFAKVATHANWLFKPHPCDEWYGGITLRDIMSESLPSHLALAPSNLNGSDVLAAADAMVTVHSTGGLEFACRGKPVLLADRGWYDRSGFAISANSRADYLSQLTTKWWEKVDVDEARRRALIYAGAYFCAPTWQQNYLMGDDSEQDFLWKKLDSMLNDEQSLTREVEIVRQWYLSGHPRLHVFKTMHLDGELADAPVEARSGNCSV